MFRETIQKMVDGLGPPDGAAGLLMGFDGIAVDSYARPGAADVQRIGMELAHIIAEIRRSAGGAQIGGLCEMQVKTDKVAVLIHIVTEDYFLIFGLPSDGNVGKARYLMRLSVPRIRAEL